MSQPGDWFSRTLGHVTCSLTPERAIRSNPFLLAIFAEITWIFAPNAARPPLGAASFYPLGCRRDRLAKTSEHDVLIARAPAGVGCWFGAKRFHSNDCVLRSL